ncbi:hypothetical protein RND71_039954 [Anisodus tanguticus]|uniref:PUM-HD domain-containing protein n=1 Tax=Anisodus tanguticus TaxID=243964 RepID=A0AAE1UR41_9SOLA|nr:hypothetical protein RND71_039954 [Anisodus tanguticus]
MYRGKEKGIEVNMKGHEEMFRMLNHHQYDHQRDVTMMGFSPSGSTSFSSGFGLYGDDLADSWNVFDHNNIDTTTPTQHLGTSCWSSNMFNDHKNVDIGTLSQRFYGMSLDDKVGFNDHFFNGTGNALSGQRGNLCDSMGSKFNYAYLCNMNKTCSNNEGFRYLEHNGFDDVGVDNSFFSLLNPSRMGECECSSIAKQRVKSVNVPMSPLQNSRIHESYSYEDNSFILQGECLQYGSEQRGLIKGHKKKSRNEKKPASRNDSGAREGGNIENHVYLAAKDQLGCRYLQRVFDEGTSQDVQIIFNGIIHHVLELMKDPFGNYLVQKFLTVCSDEQRMQFVLMVTKDPGELVKASRTTHGTRVVQKLIETMKTRMEISLVIRAIQPGILNLMMDVNGNHVIQRCLHCLSKDHNKVIFDVASRHCVDIATHRYGCCVLNKCITYSTGKQREKLLVEICSNGLKLAQDPFGNYVVQFIIELKIPSIAAMLLSQFERHYVYLSRQKFSSHVIEKLLKCFEESRSRIINELVSEPHFDQLLQDPFANYVIQSALCVTKMLQALISICSYEK